ncbi:flagellar FliL protein [Azonexus fungiphilus]|jgi:flagellar FliL protein|uniref:Flagellar protein FliL n=1 Tax=Azonexus fungiphilus TaxID=146940 RepID=A0A495VPY3_9RHOO|nr:flagellar basal body-associated FliL family protein [Azonexus fungiphilus]NHC07238.1 flagellar basal body protein FliL [Azonexus fungiphilus]RKT50415.1 flagellar FliL protein [Azonexus fungiphilus]
MAKDAKPAEEGAEAPPKKSKKLLIIIVLVVVLLVGAAAAAFLLMGSKHDGEDLDDEEVAEETVKKKPAKKKDKSVPPTFINLDPFTVNLVPETGDQYLQVAVSVELDTPESQAMLTAMMPRIRNNVTLLLSSKKASDLQPKEGKEKLASEIQGEINAAIEPPTKNKRGEIVLPEGPVVSVLFTSFIIQ